MTRQQNENFEQDRLGNVNRKIDEFRAQEGMSGADDDNEGIVTVAAGDVDSELVVYEIPAHASEVILDYIMAYNSDTENAGSFFVLGLELDETGTITGSTRRSVPVAIGTEATRSIGYEGIPFDSDEYDALGVQSSVEGEIGYAVIVDHKEQDEPGSEQTES